MNTNGCNAELKWRRIWRIFRKTGTFDITGEVHILVLEICIPTWKDHMTIYVPNANSTKRMYLSTGMYLSTKIF